ncbi:MAG: nuclear transport factor 2 family protein [Actinomycetota bacterium]
MSQENVEIMRRGYEAFNRGDFDTAMALSRPDVEFIRPGIESPPKGREAIRAWMEPDAFAEQRIEPLEFRVNGDKVLVRQRMFARGAGSGIELDTGSWAVWTLDDEGFIARGEMFMLDQEAEALEAAGLSE